MGGVDRAIRPIACADAKGKNGTTEEDAPARADEVQTYAEHAAQRGALTRNSFGAAEMGQETVVAASLRSGSRLASPRPARIVEAREARGTPAGPDTGSGGTMRFEATGAGVIQPLREFGEVPQPAQQRESGVALSHRSLMEPGQTFAVLDAAHSSPPATWIHSGTRHAEAGFLDPALGWVGVRADAVGDHVHASVVPVSAQAAQALGSHLAGLNAFLSEQHGGSATVTMGNFEGGQNGQGSSGNRGDQAGAEKSREAPRQGLQSMSVQEASRNPSTPGMLNGASAATGTAMYISVVA